MTAEETLAAIHKVIGDWMPPDSELSAQDALVLITELLERHGMKFVADDAIEVVE